MVDGDKDRDGAVDSLSKTIFCGKVPLRLAAIVVGILSAIGAFFMGLVSGLIAAGLTGEEIKLPTYVRVYRSILCVLLTFVAIFALLLLRGIFSGKAKLILPWLCLLSILMVINLLSVIVAVSLGKKLLNSTITEEIVAVSIFTSTCTVMIYIVYMEYRYEKNPNKTPKLAARRKEYIASSGTEKRLYNSNFLRIVNEAFRQKALQKTSNKIGDGRKGGQKGGNRDSFVVKSQVKIKKNTWMTPEKETETKEVATIDCT